MYPRLGFLLPPGLAFTMLGLATGKMVQQLRAPDALPEAPVQFPAPTC